MRTDPLRQDETLHVFPDSFEGWMLKDGASSEPEAYFDTQEEAVAAGTDLAQRRKVDLVVHNSAGVPV